MELVNLVIIITMTCVCISWAFRKKKEIDSTRIDIDTNNEDALGERKQVFSDEADLKYLSTIFQEAIHAMLNKIVRITIVVFAGMSVVVWVRKKRFTEAFP